MSNKRKHYLLKPTNFILKPGEEEEIRVKLVTHHFPLAESNTHKFKIIAIQYDRDLELKTSQASEIFDYYEANRMEVKGTALKCLVSLKKKVPQGQEIFDIEEIDEEYGRDSTLSKAQMESTNIESSRQIEGNTTREPENNANINIGGNIDLIEDNLIQLDDPIVSNREEPEAVKSKGLTGKYSSRVIETEPSPNNSPSKAKLDDNKERPSIRTNQAVSPEETAEIKALKEKINDLITENSRFDLEIASEGKEYLLRNLEIKDKFTPKQLIITFLLTLILGLLLNI